MMEGSGTLEEQLAAIGIKVIPGNRNKGKGNGAGPARESQSHCFADQYSKLTNTLLVQTSAPWVIQGLMCI